MKSFCCFTLSLWFLTLSGCVSKSAYWSNKIYTPVKKGLLYYSVIPNFAVEKRRMDAQMKMNYFCHPQTPNIVSERSKEEVAGHQVQSYSRKDNPLPYYQSQSTVSQSKGRSHYSKHSSKMIANPSLYAHKTTTSTPITRQRVYIEFICK